ncbi:MAG: hypothetical protein U5R14_15010 [Gemmatimonadota bacterium]|nr:hypothetical protein [Gemmatimonadota bacterium]
MTGHPVTRARWTIQEAERLLTSLNGVLSARVVARPGGDVDEIHLLTTDGIKPKQTVRNVESALLSYFDLSVDHRKISVAQTDEPRPSGPDFGDEPPVPVTPEPEPALTESRLLFIDHRMETEQASRIRHHVDIEWDGDVFTGDAVAADVPRAKLDAVGHATLGAVELAARSRIDDERRGITLALDGVKVVEAFDRTFVLTAVHAINGRHITALSGATPVTGSPDRAAILATLQATDRWVRGQF